MFNNQMMEGFNITFWGEDIKAFGNRVNIFTTHSLEMCYCSHGLRHKCSSSHECEDGLVCQFESLNRTIGVSKFISKTKLCLCDNESGFFEDVLRDICSGASLQTIANILLSLTSTVAPFIVYARMKPHF
ncbi:unnamed protein product [Ceratitis capitata]|uniref:(Mediterranean fruit fly) hypothetical protein n=1 Tax=Ceratitis capitata TaxID=7213 RepID=A0A811U7P6_CERCA|nr:unnamed protein product [Ceratitis capitata]